MVGQRGKRCQIIFLIAVIGIVITGCASGSEQRQEKKEGVAGIVQDLYESDYEFRKTETRYVDLVDDEGNLTDKKGLVTTVYEGQVRANPLESRMKVIEETQRGAWEERYVVEKDDSVQMVTKDWEGKTLTMEMGRGFDYAWRYPYGYGKDLTFEKKGQEKVGEIMCDVYITSYCEEVSEKEKGVLEAEIFQEYYIDPLENRIVMIYTDLSDFYDKTVAMEYSSKYDVSLEEAAGAVAGTAKGAEDCLEINRYREDIEIEPLE